MNIIDAISQFYQQNSSFINTIGINMLLGLSLYVTLACGQLALGNTGFMSIGAYVAAVLTVRLHAPFLVSVIMGILASMLAGYLLGLPLLRLRGVFLAIATLGFSQVVRVVILNFDQVANDLARTFGAQLDQPLEITGGPLGLNAIPSLTQGWMILLAAVGLAFFFWRLRSSRIGYAFAAIREDEDAAEAMGVNVFRNQMLSFVLAAGIAGLAGALDAHAHVFISPNEYSFAKAVQILMFGIIGGPTFFVGTMLGAALITSLPRLLASANALYLQVVGSPSTALDWLNKFPDAFNGLLLLVVITVAPGGIGGLILSSWKFIKRKLRPGAWMQRVLPGSVARALEGPFLNLISGTYSQVSVSFDPLELADSPSARAIKPKPAPEGKSLLVLDSVSRSFGGVQALEDVSFRVQSGAIHGLIGPNGAGKTTLFNIISGLIPPTSGQITFLDQTISKLPAHEIAAMGITRTFQNIRLFRTLTVLENILVGQHRTYHQNPLAHMVGWPSARKTDRERIRAARDLLKLVGLTPFADLPAGALAYGDQRRLEIARALAAKPSLLLLDEPAAGMNETETARLNDLLRRLQARGLTILLVEHHMLLVMEICSSITVLNFGQKLAEGDPATVSQNPAVIEAYLGREDMEIAPTLG